MDNYYFDMTCEGEKTFSHALTLAIGARTTKIKGYRVDEERGLIFYQYDSDAMTPFPYDMDIDTAIVFAWGWLQKVDYGNQPDHDGDNGKGWRIYNESWGKVANEWEAVIAIQPAWAMYGK